jgi:hypothetical protein
VAVAEDRCCLTDLAGLRRARNNVVAKPSPLEAGEIAASENHASFQCPLRRTQRSADFRTTLSCLSQGLPCALHRAHLTHHAERGSGPRAGGQRAPLPRGTGGTGGIYCKKFPDFWWDRTVGPVGPP